MIFQFAGINIDPDNLIGSIYQALGGVGKVLAIIAEVLAVIAIVGFFIFYFVIRRSRYPIPVRMHEINGGEVQFDRVERGGFIQRSGGGKDFKLLGKAKDRWHSPTLVQPMLQDFSSTLGGKRYINYLRIGKDVYVPFKHKFNLKNESIVELAKDIDLSSIESQLTANYLKFRGEGFWSKYGNQVILIAFAMILGIFLFLVAKEMTQTASILNSGQAEIADAVNRLEQVLRNV